MEFKGQLKTGQHIPLRTIEQVSEDYAKISHEVAQLVYKKNMAEKEISEYDKSLDLAFTKMKELNLEGNRILKHKEEVDNGKEAIN